MNIFEKTKISLKKFTPYVCCNHICCRWNVDFFCFLGNLSLSEKMFFKEYAYLVVNNVFTFTAFFHWYLYIGTLAPLLHLPIDCWNIFLEDASSWCFGILNVPWKSTQKYEIWNYKFLIKHYSEIGIVYLLPTDWKNLKTEMWSCRTRWDYWSVNLSASNRGMRKNHMDRTGN